MRLKIFISQGIFFGIFFRRFWTRKGGGYGQLTMANHGKYIGRLRN